MLELIQLFIMIFILVFFIYEFFIFKKYKKNKKKQRKKQVSDYPMEVKLLMGVYKVDIKKINYNRFLNFIAVVSSFDIALIVTIAGIFKSGIMQILVALIIVLPIIFLSYYLISLYYKYKLSIGGKKDE